MCHDRLMSSSLSPALNVISSMALVLVSVPVLLPVPVPVPVAVVAITTQISIKMLQCLICRA
jgi:hypothetical protein